MTIAIYVTATAVFSWFVRSRPSSAAFAWLVILVMVPPWYGLRVGGLSVSLALVLVAVTLIFGKGMLRTVSWSGADLTVVALGASLVVALLAASPVYLAWQGVSYWLVAYVTGRLLASSGIATLRRQMPSFAAVLGGAATLQTLFDFDVATWLPGGDANSSWIGLQIRDDLPRAELTMGHSIALAGFLTIAVPFVLMSGRSLLIRAGQFALVAAGVWATSSRAGLIACVVVVAVYAITRKTLHPALRVLNFAVLVVAAVAAIEPIRDTVSNQLDSDADQGPSARYRLQLLESFQFVRVIGLGDSASLNLDGVTYVWNGMVSIDNTPLYVGLNLGFVVALLYLLPSVAAVYWTFKRGDSPEALALVGQIILLTTVAPITQYQAIYWFVAGLMVTACRRSADPPQGSDGGAMLASYGTRASSVRRSRRSNLSAPLDLHTGHGAVRRSRSR